MEGEAKEREGERENFSVLQKVNEICFKIAFIDQKGVVSSESCFISKDVVSTGKKQEHFFSFFHNL